MVFFKSWNESDKQDSQQAPPLWENFDKTEVLQHEYEHYIA